MKSSDIAGLHKAPKTKFWFCKHVVIDSTFTEIFNMSVVSYWTFVSYWTAGFEAMYHYFKYLAHVTGNFTNICFLYTTPMITVLLMLNMIYMIH